MPRELLFADRTPAPLPERPTLVVVVDTEEEFDWEAPFSREATAVTAMRHIDRAQRLCDAAGVAPTYVIDYPVATQPLGYETISVWANEGRCQIGAHLHPWVTPPFDEAVTGPNSFMCNLPPPLQRAKLRELHDAIVKNTGRTPRAFKAGRYGIDGKSMATVADWGFAVDLSVNPCMDFTPDGGPDFSRLGSEPFWVDQSMRLLEVPCTHGFTGWARQHGRWLRHAADSLPGVPGAGILSRLRVVDRVMLSPEGNTLEEMMALTRVLLAGGLTLFSLTFHSPSLVPGHTPYVRTQADLAEFLTTIERYFEFFFGDLEGQPSTPERFRQELPGAVPTHTYEGYRYLPAG